MRFFSLKYFSHIKKHKKKEQTQLRICPFRFEFLIHIPNLSNKISFLFVVSSMILSYDKISMYAFITLL